MSKYTLAEFASFNEVGSLKRLSDDELSHLHTIGITLLEAEPTLAQWLHSEVKAEFEVRNSDGLKERGSCSIPYRWSANELCQLAMRVSCWLELKMSEAERTWLFSVLQKLIPILGAKAELSPGSGRPETLLSAKDVCHLLNIDRDALTRGVKNGTIPKPIRLGPKTHRWHPQDLLLVGDAK